MTTKSTHTPGPWKPECLFKDLDRWEMWGDGKVISSHIFGKSNARLIAAAPDLLEACKKASAWMQCHANYANDKHPSEPFHLLDVERSLCAAIAKAERKEV
jgi:hypothetical protein